MLSNEFRCAACKQVFDKGRDDEGYDPKDNCDLVCDVCYHKHFARHVNVNGAASIEDSTAELLAKEHGPHLLRTSSNSSVEGTQAYCSGDTRSCKFCEKEVLNAFK